ncbi:hypothetical protein GNI_140700 [Gregarina niphandrodes]|uniref:Uncharacterized protein n=1 Tax=Gregarina niphandrodes TaxID=110365 RepID=A0A023B0J5_GRENI|nr:hypothetical protein GNI_140700 [Gregarina niphandrodes]EZG45094.1 hypothetical protein GNI_140700 [Gregarina niphandrodes]|eukprot:XP_011132557.1 hypothetical protein GNI_140700 [Gregarina niphandrodes]
MKASGLFGQCLYARGDHVEKSDRDKSATSRRPTVGGQTSRYSYSICVGREVIRYVGSRLLAEPGSTSWHMGYHDFARDGIRMDGSVTQHYTHGYEGNEATVELRCGPTPMAVESLEDLGHSLHVVISSFAYCDWASFPLDGYLPGGQTKDAAESSSTVPTTGDSQVAATEWVPRSLAWLLSPTFGQCHNVTYKFWTYEYCHPDSLLQFHPEPNGSVKDAMFHLGVNIPSRDPPRSNYQEPNPMWPRSRNGKTYTMPSLLSKDWAVTTSTASASATEGMTTTEGATTSASASGGTFQPWSMWDDLDLHVEIIPPTLLGFSAGMGYWPREAGALGLKMYMSAGTRCPSNPNGVRQTYVYFFCPMEMINAKTMRVINVLEVKECVYSVLVEMASVCAHPLLKPKVPTIPESITCHKAINSLRVPNEGVLDQGKAPTEGADGVLPINRRAAAVLEYWFDRGNDASATSTSDGEDFVVLSGEDQSQLRSELLHAFNWLPLSAGNAELLRKFHLEQDSLAAPAADDDFLAGHDPLAADDQRVADDQCVLQGADAGIRCGSMVYQAAEVKWRLLERAPRTVTNATKPYPPVSAHLFAPGESVRNQRTGQTGIVQSVHPKVAVPESWLDFYAGAWNAGGTKEEEKRTQICPYYLATTPVSRT